MAAGKSNKHSPILDAIREVEAQTTGEIRVHLSRHWIEKHPLKRATRIFHEFGMDHTTHHNAILVYANLRRKKFAIVADTGFNQVVNGSYWDKTARELGEHLRSTHPESAIALSVRAIGKTLIHFFPLEPGAKNTNELVDEVTSD